MVDQLIYMCHGLIHGCTHRPPRRAASPRRLPPQSSVRAALVDPGRGRGARKRRRPAPRDRGPAHYTLADSGQTPSDIRILPGQVCIDPRGHLLDQSMALGVRTWGNSISGDTAMLIGTYQHATEVGARVLSRLPSDVVLRDLDSPLIGLLASEISHDSPGQAAVVDRLLDLLLVTSLRRVFSAATDHAPAWTPRRTIPSRAGRSSSCTTTPRIRGAWPHWPPPVGCHEPPSRDASPRSSASPR